MFTVTIKKIAELAGVSTATVSYVINNTKNVTPEKRRRVLEAISQSGYQPNRIAKSLRSKSTKTIGVLVEDIMGFPVPAITAGISEYAEQSGYHILLIDLRMLEGLNNQYDLINRYKDKINQAIALLLYGASVDAVVYVGMFDRDITGIISPIRKPLIIAYSTSGDSGACHVTYDSEDVSAEAVRLLFSLGRRKLAVITGLAHTNPARARLRGVLRAFREEGLSLDIDFVKNGDWDYPSGYSCMKELLEQERRPDAVFVMNDVMAAGAMDAIREAGLRIPGDISVVGFDDREIASYLTPRLTTVSIDLKGVGRAAAKMAINRIENTDAEQQRLVIPSRLIIRESACEITSPVI